VLFPPRIQGPPRTNSPNSPRSNASVHASKRRQEGQEGQTRGARIAIASAAAGLVSFSLFLGAGACIATAPEGIHRQTDHDAGADVTFWPETGTPVENPSDPGSVDPHAVFGANPSHGPFSGGQRVLLSGKGFASDARVWFGDTEVDPTTIVPVDPSRVQVTAPPGTAGAVDISVQNGDDASTRRTLAGGYAYDAIYAAPAVGPVAGGTTVEIYGQGTAWNDATLAKIDQKPCSALTVESPTLITCVAPKGTPGSKTISVTTGESTINVLDGYTYEDSSNGYKGGLSGAPIAGKLKVLVYSNFTGDPIPGAYVIAGTNVASALVAATDTTGVALFDDPSLETPNTVTVAAECQSPISFVDVPVDTVTVYLDPVLTPACAAEGDPPPVGGKAGLGGSIQGELVWEGGVEFKKAPWTTVPGPLNADERQAAYIFFASSDPTGTFNLPSPASAVTPDSPGEAGYGFTMYAGPGNRTLYAIAGIENRKVSPAKFTAYAMGVVRGVPVLPGETVENVFIPMSKTLDQAFTMDVTAPTPGPKGPDRLKATVAVMLGNDGFAILPGGQKTPLLPLSGQLTFLGVPSLDKALAGSAYLSTARAVTGASGTAPLSVIGRLLSNTTSQVVPVGGFVGVPTLTTPPTNTTWDGSHLAVTFAPGAPIDLSVYDIVSGNGLVRWTVAVPKGSHAIELPNLAALAPLGALPEGPVSISVYGGRIQGFNYGSLRYRDLRPSGMSAYSLDTFSAHL
jgi:hypothetical protein